MHVRIELYKEAFSNWFSLEVLIGVDFVHVAQRPVKNSAVCEHEGSVSDQTRICHGLEL
jgi:hypothetical protein